MASLLKKSYLVAYNAASAVAWATVLGRVVAVFWLRGPSLVPVSVDTFVRNTQSFAALELVHSVLGLVPSPFLTTFLQVASRLQMVWGITYPFPELTVSPWYSSMLTAWATTEVIRYTYFAFKEAGVYIPYALTWLRYSAFLVLYPIGITSELVMMYNAWKGPAVHMAEWYPWAIVAVAVVYIYGIPTLYMRMLKQRRNTLGSGKAKKVQ